MRMTESTPKVGPERKPVAHQHRRTGEHGSARQNIDGPNGRLVFAERHDALLLEPYFGGLVPRPAQQSAEFPGEEGAHGVGMSFKLNKCAREKERARKEKRVEECLKYTLAGKH